MRTANAKTIKATPGARAILFSAVNQGERMRRMAAVTGMAQRTCQNYRKEPYSMTLETFAMLVDDLHLTDEQILQVARRK